MIIEHLLSFAGFRICDTGNLSGARFSDDDFLQRRVRQIAKVSKFSVQNDVQSFQIIQIFEFGCVTYRFFLLLLVAGYRSGLLDL